MDLTMLRSAFRLFFFCFFLRQIVATRRWSLLASGMRACTCALMAQELMLENGSGLVFRVRESLDNNQMMIFGTLNLLGRPLVSLPASSR